MTRTATEMKLHNLLKFKTAWAQPLGEEHPVVLSSRVRLARNLSDAPFPGVAGPRVLQEVRKRVFAAVQDSGVIENAAFFLLEDLEAVDRRLLMERHLVSHELASKPEGRGLVVGSGETLSVMVNEEDHLRIQGLGPGFSLSAVYADVDRLETSLALNLPFARHPRWGYLAACPTNTGTGLRASALIHLAGLTLLGRIAPVLAEASRQGILVRGLYGEGTQVHGDLFQFSTGTAMGKSEPEYVSGLIGFLKGLVELELRSQKELSSEEHRLRTEDIVLRSLGLLTHARLLTYEEMMHHLSLVRLGILLGLRLGVDLAAVHELFLVAQPSHLQYAFPRPDAEAHDPELRAELVRKKLQSQEPKIG